MKFTGRGCSISQASASMMTERLWARTAKMCTRRSQLQVHDGRRGGVPRTRRPRRPQGRHKLPCPVKCAVLAWTALQNGLEEGGLGRLPAGSFPVLFTPEEAEEFVRDVGACPSADRAVAAVVVAAYPRRSTSENAPSTHSGKIEYEDASAPEARIGFSNVCYNISVVPLAGGKGHCTGT